MRKFLCSILSAMLRRLTLLSQNQRKQLIVVQHFINYSDVVNYVPFFLPFTDYIEVEELLLTNSEDEALEVLVIKCFDSASGVVVLQSETTLIAQAFISFDGGCFKKHLSVHDRLSACNSIIEKPAFEVAAITVLHGNQTELCPAKLKISFRQLRTESFAESVHNK